MTDALRLDKGFKTATNNSTYTYDANGNLTSDLNKNITGITYNYLNLPLVISFTGNNRIEFIYDATGTKLRKTTYANNVLQAQDVRDYVNGVEYKGGVVDRFAHTEGAVVRQADGTTFLHEYSIKDHLGNTRVTYSDANNDGIVTVADIKQINHFYPFGMNMEGNWNGAAGSNKYQYNGKEWNDDFGLGWNDYGFRMYDPAIGRFPMVDPLAEVYKNQNPYTYAANNPISLIDFMGLGPENLNQDDKKKDKDGGELPTVTVTAKRVHKSNSSGNIFTGSAFLGIPSIDPLLKLILPSEKSLKAAFNAWSSDVNPFIEREEPEDDDEEFAQLVGDGIAFVQGLTELGLGGGISTGGGALTFFSGGTFAPVSVPVAVAGGVMFVHGGATFVVSGNNIVNFAVHRKGARPSTKQKHTNPRAGEIYDKNQNMKRGEKNKKYKPKPNPNKKK